MFDSSPTNVNSRFSALGLSTALHAGALILLASFGAHISKTPRPIAQSVTLVAPAPARTPDPIPAPIVIKKRFVAPVLQKAPVPEVALSLPPLPAIRPEQPVIVTPPAVETHAVPVPVPPAFDSVEASAPREVTQPPTVRTDAFGAARAVASDSVRRAALPVGEAFDAAAADRKPTQMAYARPAGFGDAAAGHSTGRPAVASPAANAFGDTVATRPIARVRETAMSSASAVEILSKPRPAYTGEARKLRLEGEVLLKVIFRASGDVDVLQVIRGLGHGLDENAMQAARAIRFRPAERDGRPVDTTATVRISFEMAY